MAWEVDWTHPENCGQRVWARNLTSRMRSAREWHLVGTGNLRNAGISTPNYRKDSWEIDWHRRDGKKVWARNQMSKMPSAREWHWIDQSTLNRSGTAWKPKSEKVGRWMDSNGYVSLSRIGMTHDEVMLATKHDLFRGKKKTFVREHHLVAVKKFGALPKGCVVRHINGVKNDNRPENLLIGTVKENTMDHVTARMEAMLWRQRYLRLRKMFAKETGRFEGIVDCLIGV